MILINKAIFAIFFLFIILNMALVCAQYSTSLEIFDSELDEETQIQSNDSKVYANEWMTFYANYTSSDGYNLGQVLWRTPIDYGTSYSVRAIDLVGVGNKTGLVFSVSDNMTAFYSNGTVAWSVSNSNFDYAYGMATGDFNNDSREEVAFVSSSGRFYVLNGTSGAVLFLSTTFIPTGTALAIGDVDADGRKDDIVFGSTNVSGTNGIVVYIFNETLGNFSNIWNATTNNTVYEIDISEILGQQTLIGIADGTGGQAIVYYGNGSLKWQTADLGTAYSIEFFDQDSDGKEDEVAIGEDGNLRVFMDNGTSLFTKTEPWGSEYEVEKIDLDGDRKYDDMLISSNYNTLHAFNQNGTLVWTFNAPHKAFESVYYDIYFRNIRVRDLNNDSMDEIIVAGYGSKYWILNLSGSIIGKHYYGFEENRDGSEYIGTSYSDSTGIDIMNDTNGDGIPEIASSRISGYAYIGQQVMCKITINGKEDYMYYNYTSKLWEYYYSFEESDFNRTLESDLSKNFNWSTRCEKGGYQTQTSAKNITIHLKNSSLDSFDQEDDSENNAGWLSETIVSANESTYFFANYTDLEDNISLRELGFKTKYYNDLGDYMYDVKAFDYDKNGKKDSFVFSQYYGVSAYDFNGNYEWARLDSTYGYLYNLRTGDFNNDSVEEIAASSSNGYLVILNSSNGNELFKSASYSACYSLEAGDITDDGVEDLAIGCSSILGNYGILVFSYNSTTNQFQNIWSATDATGVVSEIKIAEINNSVNLIGFVDYTGQEKAYIYYGNGSKAFETSDLGTTVSALEFVDYWQDGTENDFIIGEEGETYVYSLNGSNFTHSPSTTIVYEVEKIDYYGDGSANDYVYYERYYLKLNNKTGSEMWNYSLRESYYGTLDVLDINEDGNDEIIFGGYDGILYIFNKTGSVINRINLVFPNDLSGEELLRFPAAYYGYGTGFEFYKELNEPAYLGFTAYNAYAGALEIYPKCMIYFNDSLSARMNYNASSGLYYYNRTFSSESSYSWNITCESVSHLTRNSGMKTININTAPSFVSILSSPTSLDDLDPNATVIITANISDANENIDSAILQYKNSSDLDWTNVTMLNLTAHESHVLMNASFTPLYSIEDNYTYRVWANDSEGKSAFSDNATISVYWDCAWQATSDLGFITGWDTNKNIGNITINNTGDSEYSSGCALSFHLAHNLGLGRIYFDNWAQNQWLNYYDTGFISPKSNLTVLVNSTFLDTVTEEPFVITINELGGISSVATLNTTGTIVSTSGGPYLYQELVSFPELVYLTNSQNFSFSAYVRNLAGDDTANNSAYDVSVNWSFPLSFSVLEGNLSLYYENISSSSPRYNYINLTFDSSMLENLSQGIVTVYLYAKGFNYSLDAIEHSGNRTLLTKEANITFSCYNFSDRICVTDCGYSLDPDCPQPSAPSFNTGGSGGGSGLGKYEDTFFSTKQLELVRGLEQEFMLPIKNPYNDSILQGLKIVLEGYFLDYMSLDPPYIDELQPGETKEIAVKINAPAYFTEGQYNLTFDISGKKIKNTSVSNLHAKVVVILSILEIRREDAESYLNKAREILDYANNSGYSTKKLGELVSQLEKAYKDAKLSEIGNLYEQIEKIHESIKEYEEIYSELGEKMKGAEERGISIMSTKKIFYVAEAAFKRGDFMLALEKLEEAKLAYALETKGEFSLLYTIKNNPLQTLLAIVGVSFFSFASSLVLRLKFYKKKIRYLKEEEKLLLELMKAVQTECFEESKISMEEYDEAMSQYEKKLSKTIEDRISIETKIPTLLKFRGEKKALTDERIRLIELIKEIQDQYLNKGEIESRVYENMMKSYSTRLSEVEEQLTFLDAKQALKKNKLSRRIARKIGLG